MIKLLSDNRNFRYYFLMGTISMIGDFVDDIAFAQLVYVLTKSTFVMSYVFAIKIIFSFVSIFTSAIIDQSSKKRILQLSCLMQAAILFVVYCLFQLGMLRIWMLLVFVTLQTVFSSFSIPAKNAIFSYIVRKEDIATARGGLTVISSLIRIVSYGGAGMLITFVGVSRCMVIDAVTFLIAFIFIGQINFKDVSKRILGSQMHLLSDIREGLQLIKVSHVMRIVLICTIIGNFFTAPIEGLMPAYFGEQSAPTYAFAVYMMCLAFGTALGGWIIPRLLNRVYIGQLYYWGLILGAVGMGGLYFSGWLITVMFSLIMGISYGFVNIVNGTIIQAYTPTEMMGRIFSVFKCVSYSVSPIGILMAGATGEYISLRWILLIFAVLFSISTYACRKGLLLIQYNSSETSKS